MIRAALPLGLSVLTLAVPATATHELGFAGVYSLAGSSEVDAQIGPMPFRRTLQSTVEVNADPAQGDHVTLTVSIDGRACALSTSVTAPETLTLAPQQHCPQSAQIDGDFRLDLDGTLSTGHANVHDGRMTLTTEWVVVGQVSKGALRMPVSGTIRSSQSGPRKS
jgi:hypothetical protein